MSPKGADVLLREVRTIQAVGLSAIAAFNSGDPETCLKIIDENTQLFPKRILLTELRQLRVQATRALGLLPEAIAEAEKLANDDPTTTNILNCSQLYFEKGDLKGLSLKARQLQDRTDVSSEQLLMVARLVVLEDHVLAVSLWRK